MSDLKNKISEDIKTAMKARDAQKLSVLRMVLSEIKYAQAQTNVHADISDQEVIKVVSGYAKKLEKSLADFPEGEKRVEIQKEIDIVATYLPKKASESEVSVVVDKILQTSNEKNFGALMKLVLGELKDSADGKVVSRIVKEKLENKA